MEPFDPVRLVAELRELTEHPRIEAKRAREIGPSVMQTICAFANEPGLGGGYLLLGVEEPDDTHDTYWLSGIDDPDRLLNSLQVNCREQFEVIVPIQCRIARIEGHVLVVAFVPELDPAAKPCTFKGKFDSKNKKKTGVWRRGLNSDYECGQAELEPILLAKSGLGYEQVIPGDAQWDDLDPAAIALYRKLREKVRPHAEELLANDGEMLRALSLVRSVNGKLVPNIAGLLLLGKPLALRRLLPAVRVDYVRIQGTQWVTDPEQRFTATMDFREPLLRLIPRLEATILDDMPRHFRLKEGETQRSDQPLLPQKVVREAVVNAVMHRDYQINQPTLIVRYSNRLEIRNAGYSLKPEVLLGEMGSKLRNPILAAVLYDLDFAETKGSGVRTMRLLLKQAGLTAPVFSSNSIQNQFSAVYLLHQLLGESQLEWLQQFKHLTLSDDEAKALILALETGAIDNAALRAVTGLDTLAASQVLGRLHHQRQLLVKGGAGPATYYQLAELPSLPLFDEANTSDLSANASDLAANASDLSANTSHHPAGLDTLPKVLRTQLIQLTPKARKEALWPVILWLCALQPRKAEELAQLLRRRVTPLKTAHLSKLREQHYLNYRYPEVINHPEQAYEITAAGREWLQQHGIDA